MKDDTTLQAESGNTLPQNPAWDMSQERAFMEGLLTNRFNFFLVFYGLVIAGALDAKKESLIACILLLGAVICFVLTIGLIRIQVKVNIILDELGKDAHHPYSIIHRKAAATRTVVARNLYGIAIPSICTAALIIAAFMALFDFGPFSAI